MCVVKLRPVLKDYIWGGEKLKTVFGRDNGGAKIAESWEVSVHPDGASVCEQTGGTLAAYLADNPRAVHLRGGDLPVLIKYIDAASNLSVQVHPNDAYARAHENDNGKTEMWYVVQAEKGVGIYCGFRRDTNKEEFAAAVQDGTVEKLLNFIPVRAGDCYLIKAGTVHAIGAGCMICEVQQNSNVTYRVYDYGRLGADGKPRALHVEKAAEVMRLNAFRDETGSEDFESVTGGRMRKLTECEYFRCRELCLEGEYSEINCNSYVALNALEGSGTVSGIPFTAGDSFFVPCGTQFDVRGHGKFILTDSRA